MSTTLQRSGLRGVVKPRVLHRPAFANEAAGQEAIDLAESVGLFLDPWQQLAVRVILAERADGLYAARTAGFLVARQNGKGGVLEAVALHGMFLVRDRLTLWTAHQTKTSFEGFLRLKAWIDGSDDLRRRVDRVNNSHGEEGFILKREAWEPDAPRLRFLARSKASGRGFSPQRIIFDEAQELSKLAVEAMLPSMRAQPNRQAIFTGTVPGPEINNPEYWTTLRDRGRKGTEDRMAWLEWTPTGSDTPDGAGRLDLSSRKAWVEANPSLGADRETALGVDALEGDYADLDVDSFARECLSVWPTIPPEGDGVFGPKWTDLITEPTGEPPAAIGVAITQDRMWASIGAASSGPVPHLGSVDRRQGTAWLVDEVKRIAAKYGIPVVIDSKGPASTLIDDLDGVRVVTTTTEDYVKACADLFDAVQAGGVTHGNYDALNAAVRSATTRPVLDRWAWGRKSGDVSMLEAVTLALWGATRSNYDLMDSVLL